MSGRINTRKNRDVLNPKVDDNLTKRRRQRKDVEFEEIRDNLMVRQRRDRKNMRQNLLSREM